jgi:hypothetical protein
MRYVLCLIVSGLVLGVAAAASAQSSFLQIDGPSSAGTRVRAIDDLGVFVGDYYSGAGTANTPLHGFFGFDNGFNVEFYTYDVGGVPPTAAHSITNPSPDGTIRAVGWFVDKTNVTRGVLVTVPPTGGFQEKVINFPDAGFTDAKGVNTSGFIVGKVGGNGLTMGYVAVPPYNRSDFAAFEGPITCGPISITDALAIQDNPPVSGGACVGVYTDNCLCLELVGGNCLPVANFGLPPSTPISHGFILTPAGGSSRISFPPDMQIPKIWNGETVGTVVADGSVTGISGISNTGIMVGFFSGTDLVGGFGKVDHGFMLLPPTGPSVSAFGFFCPASVAFPGCPVAIDIPNSFSTDIFGISQGTFGPPVIVGAFQDPSTFPPKTHGFVAQ